MAGPRLKYSASGSAAAMRPIQNFPNFSEKFPKTRPISWLARQRTDSLGSADTIIFENFRPDRRGRCSAASGYADWRDASARRSRVPPVEWKRSSKDGSWTEFGRGSKLFGAAP